MERHYTPREASLLLGISVRHIQKLDKQGKIKCIRTTGGRRRISESEIRRLSNQERPKTLAIYGRVSSYEQKKKGDLRRQIEYIREHFSLEGYEQVHEITDVGSGLNDKRKGLSELILLAQKKEISDIVITFEDRLTRFGYNYLYNLFSGYGVRLHVLNHLENETLEQELLKDMLAIVTSFAGKLYGMRSHRKREIVANVKRVIQKE